MIIFESFLTTSKASVIFCGSRDSSENQLEPKIELKANFACPKIKLATFVQLSARP